MPFLYGHCDTKFVKSAQIERRQKIQPLDTYKFKLCPMLEGKWKLPKNEAAIRYRTSPDTLVELCSPIVNALPLPQPQKWTPAEVADWIGKLGFPQYQTTFQTNFINGRMLLRMDASYLTRINIKDYNHIQTITKSIREMFGFGRSQFERSVSLPQRDPEACYTFFRTSTGRSYESTRRTDLFRMRHMLQPRPIYETNWQILERWLHHRKPLEKHLVEGAKGKSYELYSTKKKKIQSQEKRKMKGCQCVPPCTCEWIKEEDLRQLCRLRCLKKPGFTSSQRELCCKCPTMCVCGWSRGRRENLSILRICLPNRYDVHNRERLGRKGYKIFLGEDEQCGANDMNDIFLSSVKQRACKSLK